MVFLFSCNLLVIFLLMNEQIPISWRPILEDSSTLQIFFDYYAITPSHLAKEVCDVSFIYIEFQSIICSNSSLGRTFKSCFITFCYHYQHIKYLEQIKNCWLQSKQIIPFVYKKYSHLRNVDIVIIILELGSIWGLIQEFVKASSGGVFSFF